MGLEKDRLLTGYFGKNGVVDRLLKDRESLVHRAYFTFFDLMVSYATKLREEVVFISRE
ncbi:MAG: hypothetical protein IH840_10755 [Candidatus Heimdallarchaeota archaeon]|nr:hypothetical protein [Candidatus Heimdallarchaeota archaeon]